MALFAQPAADSRHARAADAAAGAATAAERPPACATRKRCLPCASGPGDGRRCYRRPQSPAVSAARARGSQALRPPQSRLPAVPASRACGSSRAVPAVRGCPPCPHHALADARRCDRPRAPPPPVRSSAGATHRRAAACRCLRGRGSARSHRPAPDGHAAWGPSLRHESARILAKVDAGRARGAGAAPLRAGQRPMRAVGRLDVSRRLGRTDFRRCEPLAPSPFALQAKERLPPAA